MDALTADCLAFIADSSEVHLRLIHSFALAVDVHQTPGPSSRSASPATVAMAAGSPGYPPQPHMPAGFASLESPMATPGPGNSLFPHPRCLDPVSFSLLLTIDAFSLMAASPRLGEALMMSSAADFEAVFDAAAVYWMTAAATVALQLHHVRHSNICGGVATADGYQASASGPASLALCCPEVYVHALSAGRIALRVSLLVLRVPTFFTQAWQVPAAEPPVVKGSGGIAASPLDHADSSALDGISCILPEGDNAALTGRVIRSGSPPRKQQHREQQPRSRRQLRPHPPEMAALPSDAFLELAATVPTRVLGVVHEIFFHGRTSDAALPWATLVLIPHGHGGGDNGEPPCGHLGLAPGARRSILVDFQAVPPAVQQQSIVVGQVLEVSGVVLVAKNVSAIAVGASGAGRASGAVASEYLRAESVLLPFSAAEHRRLHAESMMVTMTEAGVAATGGGGGDEAVPLSVAEEDQHARMAVRLWEGARLAFGLAEAPLPRPDNDAPLLFCTDVFSASLDGIVSILVTLLSAQGSASGASLLLLDTGTPALFPGIRDVLAEYVPSAVVDFPATVASRARPGFFLPTYHELARRPAGCSGGAGGGEGQTGTAGAGPATRRGRPAAVETIPPAHGEVVRGGALCHANRRTLVLQQCEVMLPETLTRLQPFIASSSSSSSSPATAANDSGNGSGRGSELLVPSLLSNGSPLAPACVAGDPGPFVVRRIGDQKAPYLAARSIILTVRDGAQLSAKPALFEVAQRADMVIQPAVDAERKMMAVCGCTGDPALQEMLRERREMWLGILSAALAMPHSHMFLHGTGTGEPALFWLYAEPELTKACGDLLNTYFLAAKAVCGERVDASMMETLVKLTTDHARLRVRCSHYYYCDNGDGHANAAAAEPPQTALIDALVAVGLCDATLYFLTEKTLLGECVLNMVAREIRAAEGEVEEVWGGGGILGHDDPSADFRSHFSYGIEDEAQEQRRFAKLVDASTRVEVFPAEVLAASGFSIVNPVHDLERHLRSGIDAAV